MMKMVENEQKMSKKDSKMGDGVRDVQGGL